MSGLFTSLMSLASGQNRNRRRGRVGPRVEILEVRSLLSLYTLTNLGTLGGAGDAQAHDINEAGQVVGYASAASSQSRAFLWTDGVMTDLGTLTGSSSKAFGLNNNGQVVGYAAASGTSHAFLWEDGAMTDLTPGPRWAQATDVNDDGQVIGTFNDSRIFLWEDGVFTDLGSLAGAGGAGGYALDINEAGQVVGSSYAGHVSEGIGQHAFLWEDGVMTDLGVLPGMVDSRAHGINGLGQVVGFSSIFDPVTTAEVSRSFLYSDGVMTDLNVPGDYSVAEDINDSGQVVGSMVVGSARAYIYEDGVVTDLNTLIPAGSGLTLIAAKGINNAGQIVGYAFGGGRFHAVLLTPVAEATPTVSIGDVSVTEGNTGTTTAVFTVTLSAPAGVPVTVNFTTNNGTATAGSDYSGHSGTVTFAPGQTTATVAVAVMGDTIAELNETFQVNLSRPVGAVLADGQGLGTIVDDEPRFLSIGDVTMQEGHSGTRSFVFTVTLSAPSAVPVTVRFATANGTAKASEDYNAQSGTLTFAPGQTSQTIRIVVKGDRKREANETFFVELSNVVGALLLDDRGVGTILDDE